MLCCPVYVEVSATGWSLVQKSPTVCLYVCDQETPKREAKGPPCASEWMNDCQVTVFSIYVVKVWKHKRVEATNKIILLCNTKFNVFYKKM
jgi:hypothetical protein